MKILIAPDKFKGSLSARAVCNALADGLLRRDSTLELSMLPMADGGEGTCDILTSHFKGTNIRLSVPGPLMKPVSAGYGMSADGTTAFIEMASASGLQLLTHDQRDPSRTTSLGTGMLIRDALGREVASVILGLGGSATNDAGMGMASALGFRFFDSAKKELAPVGSSLVRIQYIVADDVHPRLKDVSFTALCDVLNPLHGADGAARVYGPQKGADSAMVDRLDRGLVNFARVVKADMDIEADFPGAGAAGGAGAGAKIFLGASVKKGLSFLATVTGLEEQIRKSDLVITGEGKLDRQSLQGKVVFEICRYAEKFNKPVVIVCGRNELSTEELQPMHVRQVLSLEEIEASAEKAMREASRLLSDRISNSVIL